MARVGTKYWPKIAYFPGEIIPNFKKSIRRKKYPDLKYALTHYSFMTLA